VTFFISFRLQYTLQAGWPDWANFRLLGDCLLWVVFVKIAEIAQLIGQLFGRQTHLVTLSKRENLQD
jgi:hypothetical protein